MIQLLLRTIAFTCINLATLIRVVQALRRVPGRFRSAY